MYGPWLVAVSLTVSCVGTAALNCSAIHDTSKRFLLDTIHDIVAFPAEIQHVLPHTAEVSSSCRFRIGHLTESNKRKLLKYKSEGYTLCIGCGVHNEIISCSLVDVCQKHSVCIEGYTGNVQWLSWARGQWHGCCVPGTRHCRTENRTVHLKKYKLDVTYEKKICRGALCNAGKDKDTQELINYLYGNATSTTQLPAPKATSKMVHTSQPPTKPSHPQTKTTKQTVVTSPSTTKTTTIETTSTPPTAPTTAASNHNITCMQCDGPSDVCEFAFSSTPCKPSQNYCINDLVNNRDGSRNLVRRCGTYDECLNEWYITYSDDDKCTGYDAQYTYTRAFKCSFCCVTPDCNDPVVPATSTLFKGAY